jgi:FixJ family two-component response regulator
MTPPPRIYLLDDEAEVRKALGRLLRAAGWAVEEFSTAADLVARMDSAAAPDCVILDYQMPGLTGVEVHDLLARRGLEGRIIFVSGSADHPAPGGVQRGKAEFLAKPVRRDDLLAAVARVLAR